MTEAPDTETIPFREWMRKALFDPERGYYTTGVRAIGRGGDFATSATTSSLLGEGIAGWLRTMVPRYPKVRAVIEVGGGNGALSASVREHLGWWRRRRMAWHMVEVSPVLQEQQKQKIGPRAATWHESVSAALHTCGGGAFIFHNELVDAFPVTLLRWDGTQRRWREIWVRPEDSGWKEEPRDLDLTLQTMQDHVALLPEKWPGQDVRDTQRVELHHSYGDWLRSWAGAWREGAMLTLDYGDVFPRLYHRQPHGTLRAYFQHQRFTGLELYARMGKQDITADVNFSDLRQWGLELGWRNAPLLSQREFLLAHVRNLGDRQRDPASTFLLDPDAAGGAFKVLVQERAAHAAG